jgi:hypothetical protein
MYSQKPVKTNLGSPSNRVKPFLSARNITQFVGKTLPMARQPQFMEHIAAHGKLPGRRNTQVSS